MTRYYLCLLQLLLCIITFNANATEDSYINDSTWTGVDTIKPAYSGTLPVLYINTEENAPIVSREEYLKASCYLDTLDIEGYGALGSEVEQIALQIKGRGNASWLNSDKKPYRIKFEEKQEIMGMKPNKHFALIAHASGYTTYLTEAAGFELGKMIGLAWTPEVKPLELVVNNEYLGIYFLTEHIRIDENRVNITEQPDSCTNAEEITGGWLVEIDNYDDPYQIVLTEGNGSKLRITHKSPEVLSPEQREYLTTQISTIDSIIYAEDKSSSLLWDKYIDLDYLAKYYIVQEILDNADAFKGSTYMHKDNGVDKKWIFGPLWDLGYSFWRDKDFLYNNLTHSSITWIGEIAKFPAFQEKVREVWSEFSPKIPEIYDFIDNYAELCAGADRADAERWPQYNGGNTTSKRNTLKKKLAANIEWLDSAWTKVEVDTIKPAYSGTLPVLYINTEENAPIVSREEYLKASCYLDTLDIEGYGALGSEVEQIALQIKGRGNASWLNSDKKPYRIKFEEKQEIMGMKPNKHFALIAHASGYTTYLTEAAGFELGKMIGLAWTPDVKPLELVVNNEYLGIYFLTEHIRIDENRVNITEQPDSCTNAEEITGGWLVEIDNYDDPYQIVLTEGNGSKLRITHKSPEELSPEQREYLTTQISTIDSIIYAEDKSSSLLWDKYIDLDYLAKYYIVQEILDNADAFKGSTYMHKDNGVDKKWIFGPLWDLGYSFWRDKDFLYNNPTHSSITWIGEIAKFPAFQEKVREVWSEFSPKIPEIYDFIDNYAELCAGADRADAERWPQYNGGNTTSKRNTLKKKLAANIEWLDSAWTKVEVDTIKPAYSGTLPVLYINTEENAPIVSREEYLKASCYLDTLDIEGYGALGSEVEQIALQIKGRGNASWLNSDKKPYRIKFEEKQEIMGMKPNKHFALIAHASGYTTYLTEAAGFELGKMIGLAWTPDVKPLELVVNNEYLGIYFLTEHIRIDENRVNITEQPDSCTNAEEITGGWLVEIDNYDDPYQIVLTEGNGSKLRITHKSPEELSPEQREYLTTQISTIDSIIYAEDKSSSLLWDKYIDLDYLAKYYIVQEILDNADAFKGSTYMHKDNGVDKKWIFGPLWDLGYSFWRDKDFLYNNPTHSSITWIGEIAKFPAFQEKVREVWSEFSPKIPEIYDFIDNYAELCAGADRADAERWPQYNGGNTTSKRNTLKKKLAANIEWLDSAWTKVEVDTIKPAYSGTLPVLYINTEENAPIVSREEYLKASCYLDTLDIEGYGALGSEVEQIALQIKGRGNASWLNSDKKPYRIKFEEKQEIMGMKPNKHFALIAHASGYTTYLTEAAGFELGKMIGLAWTPEVKPLELVVNNEYLGIYFLTEHIRIDENRVNITEQPDSCTIAEDITGGWLVEIDNYDDPYQIVLTEGNGSKLRITHKSPEVLSPEQREYLTTQISTIDSIIYAEDKSSSLLWDKYIDLDYLAKYYIVQEILDNADAFKGSTYMHKDNGVDKKWIFGPLWDLGYSFWRDKDFLYNNPTHSSITWIGEIAKFPAFQEKVREVWSEFSPKIPEIYDFIDNYADLCAGADRADAERWPQYNGGDTPSKRNTLKKKLAANIEWLTLAWSEVTGIQQLKNENLKISDNGSSLICSIDCISAKMYDLTGNCIILTKFDDNTFTHPTLNPGIYIIELITIDNHKHQTKIIIR